jgi:hypothetical protein
MLCERKCDTRPIERQLKLMRGYAKILPIVFALLLVSCAKQDTGTGPHATVVMRDGTQYAGNVTNTTPSEVTLKGDDNAMHTLAMKDVKSIEYDDAAALPPAETAQSGARPAAPAQAGARPARRSLSHERHEHPQESAISSKTYALPAGTEVAVRTEETIDSGKATEGQTFAAEVTSDVRDANGDVVIPQGGQRPDHHPLLNQGRARQGHFGPGPRSGVGISRRAHVSTQHGRSRQAG